jgi:ABC-2 type transport system ATP-binding protein
MIEIERVSKDFGSTHAVRDVSFTVARGAITGLLGPNGSGKTTLMRILTGFFPPTTGRVRVAGLDAAEEPLALRRKIGYLPENVVLYPDMRVHRFLDFCADVRRLKRRYKAQRIERTVHDCGLQEVMGRRIGTLSRGYRQRVGLAQALLHEPEVLILDEPTVGLDPRQVVEIRSLIRSLRGQTTVLLSTHILPEVDMTCERVVIIDRGQIVVEDTSQALNRHVEGTERTMVRVEGPVDTVGSVLRSLPDVDQVDVTDRGSAGEGSICEFVVFSRAGEPISKTIAAAIVAHGWGLIEVRPLSLSLEDLFVRLVTKEPPSAAH